MLTPMPRKAKPPTCEDCYFHRNLLCAHELYRARATFRPNRPEGLVPPRQPVLLTRPPAGPPVRVRISSRDNRQPALALHSLCFATSATRPVLGLCSRDEAGDGLRCGRMPGVGLVRAAGAAPGFSPNVDVYYCGEPQRAVVKVDLAGVA